MRNSRECSEWIQLHGKKFADQIRLSYILHNHMQQTQFYIQLVYKPHFRACILLFWPVWQLRVRIFLSISEQLLRVFFFNLSLDFLVIGASQKASFQSFVSNLALLRVLAAENGFKRSLLRGSNKQKDKALLCTIYFLNIVLFALKSCIIPLLYIQGFPGQYGFLVPSKPHYWENRTNRGLNQHSNRGLGLLDF